MLCAVANFLNSKIYQIVEFNYENLKWKVFTWKIANDKGWNWNEEHDILCQFFFFSI